MINYSISWSSQPETPSSDPLGEGLAQHQQGALEEAIASYLKALRARPYRVAACYNLGVALIDSGLGLSSMPFFKRAVLQQPESPTFRSALLYGLARSGRFSEAEQVLQDSVQRGFSEETLADWRVWLSRQTSGAEDEDTLLSPRPATLAHEFPDTPLQLPTGSAVQGRLQDPFSSALRDYQAGRFDAVLTRLEPILAELPSWGEGHHLRGLACLALQDLAGALVALERAVELIPGRGEIWDHLGVVYARLGHVEGVVRAFEQSLVLNPLRPETWNNAADAALRRDSLTEAYQYGLQAVRLKPDLSTACYCLLQAAYKLREVADAPRPDGLDVAVGTIKSSVDSAEHAIAVSTLLAEIGLFEHAVEILDRCFNRFGNQPRDLLGHLIRNQRHSCDWRHLAEREAMLCEQVRDEGSSIVEPFVAMSIPCFGPDDLLQIARKRALQYRAWSDRADSLPEPARRRADGRLRVGYLSDDFQEHATAYLIAAVLERHDRDSFEVFAYSTGIDDGGPMRRRLTAGLEHFVDIRSLGHVEAARRIREDDIDILIDLKGYTKNARLEILALRPSPVQVTWLGFPGGLGAPFIDYLIADSVVVPPWHIAHYDESIAYLPDAYAPVDDARVVAPIPTRKEVGLPNEGFVFCCFNDPYKITPEIFDCWCGLLQDTPGSVLWLYARTEAARSNLLREAQARGIAPNRIVFASKLPQSEHLARLVLADLFLDTAPVNAHTTASDALWMGVPVLTCVGDTFASRVAASLLTFAGMPDMIAATLDDYRSRALELAADPISIAGLKTRLAAAREDAPFFDVDRFTLNLEALLLRIWDRYSSGLEPGHLEPAQSHDGAG